MQAMNTLTEEALASSKQDILLLMRKAVNKRKQLEKKSSTAGDEKGSPSGTPNSQKSGTKGEPSTRSAVSLERLLAKVESSIEETSKQSHRVILREDSTATEKTRNTTNKYADETPAERAKRLLRMADAVEQSNVRKKKMMEDPDDMSVFSSADTILSNVYDGQQAKPKSALEMGLARVAAQENDDSENYSGEEEEDDEEDEDNEDEEENENEEKGNGYSNPRYGQGSNPASHDEEKEPENDDEDDDEEEEYPVEEEYRDGYGSRMGPPSTPPASSLLGSPNISSSATSDDPLVGQLRRQLLEARTAFVTMQQNAVLRCEKLEMENHETSSSLVRAEAKLREANDRIAELEKERMEHENLKIQYAVLNGELLSCKRDYESSQHVVVTLEDDIKELKKVKLQYDEACRQLESTNAQLEATKARLKKLEDEHQNYQKLRGLSEYDQVHLLTEAQVRGAELEQELSELSKKHRSFLASHDELRMIIMSSCRKCRLRLPREQYVAKAVERKKQSSLANNSEENTDLSVVKATDAKLGGSLSQFLDSFGLFTKSGDDQSVTSRKAEAPGRQTNRTQVDVVMTQIERRMSDDLTTLKKSWLAPLNLGGSSSRKSSDESAAADLKKKVEEGLAASNKPKKKKSNGDRQKVPASPRTGKGRVQDRDAAASPAAESERGDETLTETEVVPETQTVPKKPKKTLGDVLDNQSPERPPESRDAMSLASSIVLAKRRLSSSHKSESGNNDVEKKMLEILVSDSA